LLPKGSKEACTFATAHRGIYEVIPTYLLKLNKSRNMTFEEPTCTLNIFYRVLESGCQVVGYMLKVTCSTHTAFCKEKNRAATEVLELSKKQICQVKRLSL
jgi:hypothetical protein